MGVYLLCDYWTLTVTSDPPDIVDVLRGDSDVEGVGEESDQDSVQFLSSYPLRDSFPRKDQGPKRRKVVL